MSTTATGSAALVLGCSGSRRTCCARTTGSEQRLLATIGRLEGEAIASRVGVLAASGGLGDWQADADDGLAPALAALPADQRDALLLHVWGELSYAEIAEHQRVPVGTVRSRISRACAALRSSLQGETVVSAMNISEKEQG
jgi:DNA-directed RNA polymerase specialized sigma24 family protein